MPRNYFSFRQASVRASDSFRLCRFLTNKYVGDIFWYNCSNNSETSSKLNSQIFNARFSYVERIAGTPALPVARYRFEQGKKCPKVVRRLSEACPKGRAPSKPRGALVDILRTCQSLSLSAWWGLSSRRRYSWIVWGSFGSFFAPFFGDFQEKLKTLQCPKVSEALSEAWPKGRILHRSVAKRFSKLTIYMLVASPADDPNSWRGKATWKYKLSQKAIFL